MKEKDHSGWTRVIAWSTLFLTSLSTFNGQTQLNLGTQGRNVDFTNAPYTKPIRLGSTLPNQCSAGEFFLNTGASPGQNLFACLGASWTMLAGTSGLADPGANGLIKRTGVNVTTAVAAPNGTVVGTTDVQTLTGKSIDASEINSGVFTAARMPGLTGDITSAASSNATVLATVLQSPGSFGDANHTLQLTVDGKGRVTALTTLPITTGLTSAFYQQLMGSGTAAAQRAALNFSSAFTVADNAGSSRTEVSLAAVNGTTGTFGGANQIPVITVNAYGQITAVTTAASASTTNSSTSQSSVASGALSAIPSSCSTGALYFSIDQPVGQQLYVCSAANTWSQSLALGNSGALAFTNGSLDIVNSVLPRLTAANHFTGSNQLDGMTTLSNVNITGTCTGCNSSGFTNPMTAMGDQIVGGMNGAATRATVGAPGQVWTVGNAGQPIWASLPATTPPPSYSGLTQEGNGTLDLSEPFFQYLKLIAQTGRDMQIAFDMSQTADGTSGSWFANQLGGIFGLYVNPKTNPGGVMIAYSGDSGYTYSDFGLKAGADLSAATGVIPNDNHSAVDPPCSSPTTDRNRIWITNPGSGTEDGMKVCHMLANGTMAWKVVY